MRILRQLWAEWIGLTAALCCLLVFFPSPLRAKETGRGSQAQESSVEPSPRPLLERDRDTLNTLSDYLANAALNNPELESAFYRWKAALEKIPQVKTLPDPRFTFAYYIQSVETRVGPQVASVALFQTFPWFGVLDLRGDIAAEEANALKAQYDALKLRLFYDVKNSFYEYAYLAQAIQITREDVALLKYLESVARARYSAGATPYSDVLKTQVQLGRLEDRLKTAPGSSKADHGKIGRLHESAAGHDTPLAGERAGDAHQHNGRRPPEATS